MASTLKDGALELGLSPNRVKQNCSAESAHLDTYSEEYRHACEIRFVLCMPTKERRAAYLALVETRRGKAAADRLRQDVLREWRKR